MGWKVLLVLVAGLVLSGCRHFGKTEEATRQSQPLVGENTEVRKGGAGDQIVGNYRVYDKALYEKARLEGKTVLVYFYANWCPTCRAQEPEMVSVFKSLTGNPEIVAFRVNYNDNETTPDGKEIALTFEIVNQHTFVVLGKDGMVRRKWLGAWRENDMKEFLEGVGE